MYDLKFLTESRERMPLAGELLPKRLVLKYTKEVTNLDQMVPIFSCVPRPVATGGTSISFSIEKTLPEFDAYLKTLNPILSILVKWYIVTGYLDAHLYSAVHFWSTNKAMKDQFHPVIVAYLGNKSRATDAINKSIRTISGDDIVKNCTTALIGYLLEMIPGSARVGTGYTPRETGWHYGVYPTVYHTGLHIGGPVVDTTTLDAPFESPIQNNGNFTIRRYGYLGIGAHQTSPRPAGTVQEIQTTAMGDLEYNKYHSYLTGIHTAFVVMIKASKRVDLIVETIVGDLNMISWEKGEIELWEDEDVKKLLSYQEYKEYHDYYYKPFRNELGATIRSIKNLSHTLFDIPVSTATNPIAVKKEIEDVLKMANANRSLVSSSDFPSPHLSDFHRTYA
jgi:hypothetical protein